MAERESARESERERERERESARARARERERERGEDRSGVGGVREEGTSGGKRSVLALLTVLAPVCTGSTVGTVGLNPNP